MKRMAMAGILVCAVSGCAAESTRPSAGVNLAATTPGKTVRVHSVRALQQALTSAAPGERIEVADGKYVFDGPLSINRPGTASHPIVIAAEHVGGVEIDGSAGFTFGDAAAYDVLEGFVLKHAMVPMLMPPGTNHLRVTRNVFALLNDHIKGERPDIEVSGDDCEIDHNTFRDKATEGPMITVQGPGKDQMAQRTWIHHNYFYNFMPTANNCSAVQIGLSWRSMASAHSLTEHNLFAKCRGENEGAICNKSCDNVYRYNTFTDGTRELSLRHGNRNVVYGNYFLGTDGIRFFGHDDLVYSNYFQGCHPAIHVGNGDATIPPGRLQMHDEPVGCQVVFNTLVNNTKNIIMAPRGKPYGARNITIANNLIVGGPKAADIQGPLVNSTWEGNLIWKTDPGTMPAGSYREADPHLHEVNGVMHPEWNGLAEAQAVGSFPFVKVDVEGRDRRATKQVGAEQGGTGGGVSHVLTRSDGGPAAK